jgi:hypothetical protein
MTCSWVLAAAFLCAQATDGSAWDYIGIQKPSGYFAPAAATAETAAAAAASGREVMYRARINTNRHPGLRITNRVSPYQAVAARAHDVWTGDKANFTDKEWRVVGSFQGGK